MYMYVTTDLDAFQESIIFENSIHDNVLICQSRSHTCTCTVHLLCFSCIVKMFVHCKLQCTMYDDSGEL